MSDEPGARPCARCRTEIRDRAARRRPCRETRGSVADRGACLATSAAARGGDRGDPRERASNPSKATLSTTIGSPSVISTVMATLSFCVVELHVDVDDLRLGIAPVGVVRLDALDVAIELWAIEKSLARPWQKAALPRRENRLQLVRLDGARAAELDGRHLDVAGLPAAAAVIANSTTKMMRRSCGVMRRAEFLPSLSSSDQRFFACRQCAVRRESRRARTQSSLSRLLEA